MAGSSIHSKKGRKESNEVDILDQFICNSKPLVQPDFEVPPVF
jgi:hypothetical protein